MPIDVISHKWLFLRIFLESNPWQIRKTIQTSWVVRSSEIFEKRNVERQIRTTSYHRSRSSVWSSRPLIPSAHPSPTGHPEAHKNTMAALTVHIRTKRGSYIIKQKWHCFFSLFPSSLGNQAPVRHANQFHLQI